MGQGRKGRGKRWMKERGEWRNKAVRNRVERKGEKGNKGAEMKMVEGETDERSGRGVKKGRYEEKDRRKRY